MTRASKSKDDRRKRGTCSKQDRRKHGTRASQRQQHSQKNLLSPDRRRGSSRCIPAPRMKSFTNALTAPPSPPRRRGSSRCIPAPRMKSITNALTAPPSPPAPCACGPSSLRPVSPPPPPPTPAERLCLPTASHFPFDPPPPPAGVVAGGFDDDNATAVEQNGAVLPPAPQPPPPPAWEKSMPPLLRGVDLEDLVPGVLPPPP